MIIVTTVIAVAFSSLFMIEYLFLNQGGVGISWLQPAPPPPQWPSADAPCSQAVQALGRMGNSLRDEDPGCL